MHEWGVYLLCSCGAGGSDLLGGREGEDTAARGGKLAMGSGSLGSDALGGRNGEPPCGLGGSDGMGSGSREGSDGVGSGSSLDLLKLLVYVCELHVVLIVKGFRLNVTYCRREWG